MDRGLADVPRRVTKTVRSRVLTGPQSSAGTAPRLLSAQAAARYLGVPYTSLRDWALRGHLPIVRVPDCRRLWFDRADLDRSIEAWKERAG